MEKQDYLNIGAYRFVDLPESELPALREKFRTACADRSLRGTIQLSIEGININLSGLPDQVAEFRAELEQDPRFANLEWKDSWSDYLPFNRLLIKLKREIISMGCEAIRPVESTAPRVEPRELRQWIEEGRDIELVDTRNWYETRLGTFEGAKTIDIATFRAFPDEVDSIHEDKSKPIVTFCTGGIRCEKAAALMMDAGYENVWQLNGGILKYFEECGGEHYDGECFVYDRRVAVDPELQETETVQCFNCIYPVTPEEQKLESYVPGVSCTHCIDGKPSRQKRGER